ncbi:MAG: T9SS type A sorting domain-containing protein [Tannerellaceae bacterium]
MKTLLIASLALALWAGDVASGSAREAMLPRIAIVLPESDPIEITASDNRIRVINAPIGSVLEIYSVVGIKVKEIEIKQPNGEYLVSIAKGYYIIRIGDTVRKIAIR